MTDQLPQHPITKRPNPLRVGENPFATNTMKVRKPKLIREVQILNRDYPESIRHELEKLHHDLASGSPIPMLDFDPAPPADYENWAAAFHRQQKMFNPLTWHNVEWFFVETYLYRYLMQLTRWFESGRDPFTPQKHAELENGKLWHLLTSALDISGSPEERLPLLLGYALWGNRVDLSYNVSNDHGADGANVDDLLVDDRAAVMQHLEVRHEKTIHVIADNSGTELVMDLVLLDALLSAGVGRIVMHLKVHPTYVSDAIPADIWHTLAAMDKHGGSPHALAERLRKAWAQKKLILASHPYWNSSRFLWDMPGTLQKLFSDAFLVIVKGDANYRRAVGDGLWNIETAFETVMRYFPAPLLTLRTMKSDPVIGISAQTAAHLDSVDPEWRVNGQRGVIQFKTYTSID